MFYFQYNLFLFFFLSLKESTDSKKNSSGVMDSLELGNFNKNTKYTINTLTTILWFISYFLLIVELNESTRTILWAKYDPKHNEHVWVAQQFCSCIFRISPGKNGINKYVYLNGKFDENITSHLYM